VVRFIALGCLIAAISGGGWYIYLITSLPGRAKAKIKEAEKIIQLAEKSGCDKYILKVEEAFKEGYDIKEIENYFTNNKGDTFNLLIIYKTYTAANNFLRSAQEASAAGNYESALKYAKSAIQKAKEVKESARIETDKQYGHWFVEGEEQLKNKNYVKALSFFQKALNCRQNDIVSKEKIDYCKQKLYGQYFNRGKGYASRGEWNSAIGSYQKSLEYKPGDSKAENELKFGQSKIRKQKELKKRDEEQREQKIADCISKGKSYMGQKKYSQAVDEFQKAVDIGETGEETGLPTVWNLYRDVNLGATGEAQGLLAEAKKKKKYDIQKGEWSIIDDDLVIVGTGGGNYLMWPRDKDSAGCKYGGNLDWSPAMSWAGNLVYKGYDDWRLPTKNELEQLYNYGRTYITTTGGWYWSSTEYVPRTIFTKDKWFVVGGTGSPHDGACCIRPVRAGP